MQLDDALRQISDIRHQMARSEVFRGYRSVTVGLSGGLGCLLVPLAQLGILVFHVVCIAKALEGERLLVPGLSDFADKF